MDLTIQMHAKNSKNRVILNQESTRCLDAKFGLHKSIFPADVN